MTGATAKSRPGSSKLDDTELARLRKQDYWLQVTRAKLVMDLIFVCKLSSFTVIISPQLTSSQTFSLRNIRF